MGQFDLSTAQPVKSNLRHSGREVGSLGSRSDDRNIAYKVPGTGLDLWPIFGTLTLVVFVLAFAMIVWQGRHMLGPTSLKTPTDRIVLIASPQPTRVSGPSPEPTSTPSPQAQLV